MKRRIFFVGILCSVLSSSSLAMDMSGSGTGGAVHRMTKLAFCQRMVTLFTHVAPEICNEIGLRYDHPSDKEAADMFKMVGAFVTPFQESAAVFSKVETLEEAARQFVFLNDLVRAGRAAYPYIGAVPGVLEVVEKGGNIGAYLERLFSSSVSLDFFTREFADASAQHLLGHSVPEVVWNLMMPSGELPEGVDGVYRRAASILIWGRQGGIVDAPVYASIVCTMLLGFGCAPSGTLCLGNPLLSLLFNPSSVSAALLGLTSLMDSGNEDDLAAELKKYDMRQDGYITAMVLGAGPAREQFKRHLMSVLPRLPFNHDERTAAATRIQAATRGMLARRTTAALSATDESSE